MKNSDLFFSVIIPVFNTEKYLRECLDSVIHQSYNSWEIIIVEDCSTDNSLQIAEEYQKQYPNIKLIRHNKNRGLGAARNNGIKHATGKYIVFLDSDDWLKNTTLKSLNIALKKHPAIDVALIGMMLIDEKNNILSPLKSNFKEGINDISADKSRFQITASACDKCFKTEFIKKYQLKFPENHIVFEDVGFFLSWSCLVNKIYVLKSQHLMYRQRSSISSSKTNNRKIMDIFKTLEDGKEQMIHLKQFEKQKDFFYAIFLMHTYFIQLPKIKDQRQMFLLRFIYYKKIKEKVIRFKPSKGYLQNLNPILAKAYQEIISKSLWFVFINLLSESIKTKLRMIKKLWKNL